MKTEEELIADFLAGKDSAFDEIVRRYLDTIYHFLLRLSGRPADAEDLAQEVFLKLWRNLKKFRVGGNFRNWLFQIAYRVFIDWTRKKKMPVFSDFETETGNEILENLADSENLPSEMAVLKEDRQKLNNLLESLSPLSKTVVLLRHKEEMTFEEISGVMNEPLNTVRSRYRRALIKMRLIFKAESS